MQYKDTSDLEEEVLLSEFLEEGELHQFVLSNCIETKSIMPIWSLSELSRQIVAVCFIAKVQLHKEDHPIL